MSVRIGFAGGPAGPGLARYFAFLMGVLLLPLLAGCGEETGPGPGQAPGRGSREVLSTAQGPMAAYEGGAWPSFLRRLALPPGRDYAVLAYLPSPVPFDMSSSERLRASANALNDNPLHLLTSKSMLGHVVVAWQCGGLRGVTSMSGEREAQGWDMARSGWGIATVLSTFLDGHLVPAAAFPADQDRAFGRGDGIVTAFEITPEACDRMRGRVRSFASDPARPADRYSLISDPAAGEGAGCLSFAWHVAEGAGVMPGMSEQFRRTLVLREAGLGRGTLVPVGVEPFCPGDCDARGPVPLDVLLARRWDEGPEVGRVTVPDGELFLAALVAMRQAGSRGTGQDAVGQSAVGQRGSPSGDWRQERVIGAAREDGRAAAAFGRQYAALYPVARIADPRGVSALVLERD